MAAPKRRYPGPRLEVLEDRSVPAVIGGIVYNDANTNGLYDAGETPLAGVTLKPHALPRGSYRVVIRAVDASGNKERPGSGHNILAFRIR